MEMVPGRRWLEATAALLLWGSAAFGQVSLRSVAEAFAGRPLPVDPRLAAPDCPGGLAFSWREPARDAIEASCPASGWSTVLPVGRSGFGPRAAAQPPGPALVRRGEPVVVAARGPGFQIRAEGIAEGDGRAGSRIMVRNSRSGTRFVAVVGPDGALAAAIPAGNAGAVAAAL
jgi:hypothetical protein